VPEERSFLGALKLKVCTTIAALRAELLPLRRSGKSIGLVPTMGYLHVGHMALVKTSKSLCDATIVSIFVNPTQFAVGEDLSTYPRDLDRDLAMLEAEVLMGKIRPGHFRGVATVCTKLFNIAMPDKAFFGQKDFQQAAVMKRMVSDLNQPLEIVAVPTVREPDGLACSSRNVRLTLEDRRAAVVLSQSLSRAGELVASGERSISAIRKTVREVLKAEPRGLIEAVDLRDASTLEPVSGEFSRPVVVLLTIKFGSVRLIDNRVYAP
jgi:pantoate--beta-alanine ligase